LHDKEFLYISNILTKGRPLKALHNAFAIQYIWYTKCYINLPKNCWLKHFFLSGLYMDFRQSFSKPAGTPVVLNHKSIYISFFKQYFSPPPPPSPINVGFRIRIELRIKSEKIGCQHWIGGGGEERYFRLMGFGPCVPTNLKMIVWTLHIIPTYYILQIYVINGSEGVFKQQFIPKWSNITFWQNWSSWNWKS
jgi:hypothetical protein